MGDENFMATFITGLVILLLGGYLYGKFVEHVFKPCLLYTSDAADEYTEV